MLRIELKKAFSNKMYIGLLVIALVINAFYSYRNVRGTIGTEKDYRQGELKIYEDYSGDITQEKADEVTKLNDEALANEMAVAGLPYDSNTYTGYKYGDYQIYKELYEQMKYMVEYKSFAEEMCGIAEQNIQRFGGENGEYTVTKNEIIRDTFEGRRVNGFSNMIEFDELFSYNFSSLLIIFIAFVMCIDAFSGDRETKMLAVILTTKEGYVKRTAVKIISRTIVVWTFALLLYLQETIYTVMALHLSGFGNKLYAIETFQYTSFGGPIWLFMIINTLCKLLGMLGFILLFLLASSLGNRILSSCIYGIIAFIGIVGLYVFNSYIGFVRLLDTELNFKQTDIIDFMGKPYKGVYANIVFASVLCVAMFALIMLIETKGKKLFGRERV